MNEGPATLTPGSVWATALASIEAAQPRRDLHLEPIDPPSGLAPDAVAFAADVHPATHGVDSELGVGRFILLHDETAPEAWDGVFRVVCYAQAPLDREIGSDPLLPEVAWSWLVDALDGRGAAYREASGTATTVLSTGFGALAGEGQGAQIEFRASWTPLDPALGVHLEAWGDFLCMLAGLPAEEGVVGLDVRRSERSSGGR